MGLEVDNHEFKYWLYHIKAEGHVCSLNLVNIHCCICKMEFITSYHRSWLNVKLDNEYKNLSIRLDIE